MENKGFLCWVGFTFTTLVSRDVDSGRGRVWVFSIKMEIKGDRDEKVTEWVVCVLLSYHFN